MVLSVLTYRPFCKYLCPLGAFYALFNRFSLYRLTLDKDRCIDCRLCEKICKMGIQVTQNINSPECIRCGDCMEACPKSCISREQLLGKSGEKKDIWRYMCKNPERISWFADSFRIFSLGRLSLIIPDSMISKEGSFLLPEAADSLSDDLQAAPLFGIHPYVGQIQYRDRIRNHHLLQPHSIHLSKYSFQPFQFHKCTYWNSIFIRR